MMLFLGQLAGTPSTGNTVSTFTSNLPRLPPWNIPCAGPRVLLKRSMNVLGILSVMMSTRQRVRLAMPVDGGGRRRRAESIYAVSTYPGRCWVV